MDITEAYIIGMGCMAAGCVAWAATAEIHRRQWKDRAASEHMAYQAEAQAFCKYYFEAAEWRSRWGSVMRKLQLAEVANKELRTAQLRQQLEQSVAEA